MWSMCSEKKKNKKQKKTLKNWPLNRDNSLIHAQIVVETRLTNSFSQENVLLFAYTHAHAHKHVSSLTWNYFQSSAKFKIRQSRKLSCDRKLLRVQISYFCCRFPGHPRAFNNYQFGHTGRSTVLCFQDSVTNSSELPFVLKNTSIIV